MYWFNTLFHPTSQTALGPEWLYMNLKKNSLASDSYTVTVYYYPWYHTDFHGPKYIQGGLDLPLMPMLGEYNDRDTNIIRQHLEWS